LTNIFQDGYCTTNQTSSPRTSPQSVGTRAPAAPGQLLSDGDRLMVVADGTDCLGTGDGLGFPMTSGMVMMPP